MGRDLVFWALMALAAAGAAAYGLYYLRRPPSLMRALVKTSALGLAIALFRPSPVILPLAFSALGDLALAFDKKWALPLGIGAFLIAQLLYLLSFFGLYVMAGYLDPIWPRHLAIAVIGGGAIAYFLWLWGRIGWLALGIGAFVLAQLGYVLVFIALLLLAGDVEPHWPVYLAVALIGDAALILFLRRQPDLRIPALGIAPYAAAIAGMAMMSFWLDWRGWPAMLGAVLFLISDGVLAAELFKLAPDAPARRITAPVVWWTYIGAQVLIVTGLTLAVTGIQ
jgi:uncharacterized membrane protein YhhN